MSDLIARLRELQGKITPGEWITSDNDENYLIVEIKYQAPRYEDLIIAIEDDTDKKAYGITPKFISHADAELCAFAPQMLKALIEASEPAEVEWKEHDKRFEHNCETQINVYEHYFSDKYKAWLNSDNVYVDCCAGCGKRLPTAEEMRYRDRR